MLKFTSRAAARNFAKKANKRVIDLGKDSQGSRWVVRVINL